MDVGDGSGLVNEEDLPAWWRCLTSSPVRRSSWSTPTLVWTFTAAVCSWIAARPFVPPAWRPFGPKVTEAGEAPEDARVSSL